MVISLRLPMLNIKNFTSSVLREVVARHIKTVDISILDRACEAQEVWNH